MATIDLSQCLFSPRSIALIGASADASKNSGRPQRYLQKHGFKAKVFPVNPAREDVQGVKAYASVLDISDPVDHAFIMVPAAAVLGIVKECCAKGIGAATIYSDGFAETGEQGQALQDEIVALAANSGLRLLGPNSMGLINTHTAMTLSVNAVLELNDLPTGDIGLISQSGTILGTLLSRGAARGIGFSKLISLGNESDLSVGELCNLLVDDPDTRSIVLFLEGLRNADELASAARRAFDAGKPVIAYKLGRSDAGRALAVSHSGAIAGTDRCVQAFFEHHGIIRVNMLENLFESPALFAAKKPVRGKRVSVVTTTGGGAALVADRMGEIGLELAPPSGALRQRLSNLGLEIGAGPLIDLTMAGTRKGIYGEALDELLGNDDCDAVVAVVGSSGQFHPELAVAPIVNTDARGKFLAAFIAPEADQSLASLADTGIAAFRTPEACADAVCAALNWKTPADVTPSSIDLSGVERLLQDRTQLNEADAGQIFAALGITQVSSTVIDGPEAKALSEITYPVAVKVLSNDIAHKTDVGGVVLSITDEKALRQAYHDISASVAANAPDAAIDGFLVQQMESGLANVLIGFRRDPEVGPFVVLGTGGILAELYDDVAIRPAPVDKSTALKMINEVRGLAILRGYRSKQKGDIEVLADAVVAISQLAHLSETKVQEAEINPLIVKAGGQGVVAVDGLIVCG
jgi:acyl-CoA synthetase (NDP forming)